MSFLEILLFVFIIIEALQLRQLITASKVNNTLLYDLMHNPKVAGSILRNGFLGMADDIKNSPEYQAKFFDFIQAITSSSYVRLKAQFEAEGINASDIATKIIQDVTNRIKTEPALQEAVLEFIAVAGNVAYSSAINSAKQEITRHVEKQIPVPKKYRWVAEIIDRMKPKQINEVGGSEPAPVVVSGNNRRSKLSQL